MDHFWLKKTDCQLNQEIHWLICQTNPKSENNPKPFKYLFSAGKLLSLYEKSGFSPYVSIHHHQTKGTMLHSTFSPHIVHRLLPLSLLSCCCVSLVAGCCLMWLYQYAAHMGLLPASIWKEVGALNITAEKTLNCMEKRSMFNPQSL